MRFRSAKTQASPARTSGVTTPSSVAPQQRNVPWRSLWSRVYTRWATAPPATSPVFVVPSSMDVHTLPGHPPTHTRHYPHLGLREYWQRKRGELWFITKRREDGDLQFSPTSDSAEEVEVVPPPQDGLRRTRGRRRITLFRMQSKSQRTTDSSLQPRTSSEIEIAMSSFSLSSDSEDEDCDDYDGFSGSDENPQDAEASEPRDSYEHAADDPFLQRYSSWYSIDDEQQTARALPDEEEDEEYKDGEDRGMSPTLEALYGVRHVDLGVATVSPSGGIWV